MLKLVLASFLALTPSPVSPATVSPWANPPKANLHLRSIRHIACGESTGTANYIDPRGILVTAYHVADSPDGICTDVDTDTVYTIYHKDEALDIALLHGDTKGDKSFMKSSCKPMVKGKKYLSVGWAGYDLRFDVITYTGNHQHKFDFDGGIYYSVPFADSTGTLVPGMSGGAVIDMDDWSIVGINNISRAYSHSFTRELKDTILCKR